MIPAVVVPRATIKEAGMITDADRTRIADAIRAAEAKTSGEIFCVLANNAERVLAEGYQWLMCPAPRSFATLDKLRAMTGQA